MTGLEVSDPRMQLCEKNPGDLPNYSTIQSEKNRFAFYQTSDSFDGTSAGKMMTELNYTYSRDLRPNPWKGQDDALLVQFRVAVPLLSIDRENAVSAGRVVLKISYENPNHKANNRYYWLKPQFFASGNLGPTDNIRIDPNTGIVMAKSYIKRDSKFMQVTKSSHLIKSQAFLNEKLFEVIVGRQELSETIDQINSHKLFSGVPFPKGSKHWKHYRVKGFSLNQETNIDSKKTGVYSDFESSMRGNLFRAFVGTRNR